MPLVDDMELLENLLAPKLGALSAASHDELMKLKMPSTDAEINE